MMYSKTLLINGLSGFLFVLLITSSAFGQDTYSSYELPDVYEGQEISLPCDVDGMQYLEIELSDAQLELLRDNGFVVRPLNCYEFSHLYEDLRYSGWPVYITTDSVLHVYHLLFNKLLRELEEDKLIPAVTDLTVALTAAAQRQYAESRGTELEESCRRVWAYFAIAEQLLLAEPPPVPDEIAVLVNAELDLIRQHDAIYMSPLLSLPGLFDEGEKVDPTAPLDDSTLYYAEDYSQYTPRGHYTRTPTRSRYFQAMMWYGRVNYRLINPHEAMQALLVTRLLDTTAVGDKSALAVWASIYEPTAFLVGNSDDLGYFDIVSVAEPIYGSAAPALDQLANPALLDEFLAAARLLPPPQINSMWVNIWEDEEEVTRGFRFMGQRFVLDAFIFENLIWRKVGTPESPRMLPRALDVFAAFGNDEALAILAELGETDYEHYATQMVKLRTAVAAQPSEYWDETLYAKWLQMLLILAEEKAAAYPAYMQTPAWARKDLHSSLGSWTELKHDTILYAKQVMAEMGDGGEEYVPPLNHVEPVPRTFNALLELAALTRSGLEAQDLLTPDIEDILNSLTEEVGFFRDIALRELTGGEFTTDENDRLLYAGGWLEWMTMSSADVIEEGENAGFYVDADEAALVTDVATDPSGFVLEEATGRIFEILVATPAWDGGVQISYGGVFSYYEFPWPLADRLTDEKWREMLCNDEQPARPEWTSEFIAE
ncbi:DUF3160 domain-containing protein [bacterium]|nr:DUF3160 domain-containing protein [bacterium]